MLVASSNSNNFSPVQAALSSRSRGLLSFSAVLVGAAYAAGATLCAVSILHHFGLLSLNHAPGLAAALGTIGFKGACVGAGVGIASTAILGVCAYKLRPSENDWHLFKPIFNDSYRELDFGKWHSFGGGEQRYFIYRDQTGLYSTDFMDSKRASTFESFLNTQTKFAKDQENPKLH